MSDKKEKIKHVNGKVLFGSRKNFGMYGNIQWSVVDINDDNYDIRISSSRDDIEDKKDDIAKNITESVIREIPEANVKTEWVEWESDHGSGALVSTAGKTEKEVPDELLGKLNLE